MSSSPSGHETPSKFDHYHQRHDKQYAGVNDSSNGIKETMTDEVVWHILIGNQKQQQLCFYDLSEISDLSSDDGEEEFNNNIDADTIKTRILRFLMHTIQCRSPFCQYVKCVAMKWNIRHAIKCKTSVSGDCLLCKRVWVLINAHGKSVNESQCGVPQCRLEDTVSEARVFIESILMHATQCRSPFCRYVKCGAMKSNLRHGTQCKTRMSGGCLRCMRLWAVINLHSESCNESECGVLRCRDFKERAKMLQQKWDSEEEE